MRVLVVTSTYPTPSRPGLGGFVRDQVEALREIDGLELELFTYEPGGARNYLRAARALRRAHRRRSYDLIHAHYGLSGWVARALGRRAPLVVTFHGTDLRHAVVGPLSRVLARGIDLPAPVSTSLARDPAGGLPGAGETRGAAVLPCGVNLDRFGPRDRRDARGRLGIDPDSRYLLVPADPARPEKRHDRASELAAAAGVELLTYAGASPERIPDLINAANAVIATSEREGYGLAPLEALASDVPVVATDVGIAPVALRGVAGTLSAAYDPRIWLDALRPHLDAADPRIDGRRRASLFGRNRMAERVFEAYREVIRSAASG
jgi:teichuronic acid biosynthesis glycosyltransferase TuaC